MSADGSTGGNNSQNYDHIVRSSYYHDVCAAHNDLFYEPWEGRGFSEKMAKPDDSFVPRVPVKAYFEWDELDNCFAPPETSCLDFPEEEYLDWDWDGTSAIGACWN